MRRELSSVPEAFFGRLQELLADRDRRIEATVAVAPELVEATRTVIANGLWLLGVSAPERM